MRQSLCAVIALTFLILPGCASKYAEQRTQVYYYPACYQPIQDLRNNEGNVGKSTAVGAGIGAVGGALIGLLATGKWQGAVMGAAVGGVGGTMAGAAYGRRQQERDDNMRLAGYLQDIDGDISNLDITSAAARTSLQCYDRQFNVLLGQIKSRQITREAAQQRFAEIQNGREEAIAILGNAYQYGSNMNQQYEQAFVSEERQISAPVKRASYQQNARTLNTARQRQRRLTQKTEAINETRSMAQANTAQQTQQINSAMAELQDIRL